jgi:hypothetical protein
MSDTPQIADASRYMRYLPAVFAKSGDDFLGRYLKIFEKLLTGLDDGTLDGRRGIQELLADGVIGNLFYSRFSFLFPNDDHDFIPLISGLPASQEEAILAVFNSYIGVPATPDPTAGYVASLSGSSNWETDFLAWLNDFLNWLASWMDLVLGNSWTLDKKRLVIAEIMALYRLRGTVQGMSMLIDLLLDLPVLVNCYTPPHSAPVTGPVSVTVSNPVPPPIVVTGEAGVSQTFVLQCAYRPGMPLISGYAPWLFLVQVILPAYINPQYVLNVDGAQQVQTLLGQLTLLLDAMKPAATHYQMQILGGMCLQPYPDPLQPTIPQPPQLTVNAVLGTQMPSP